MKISAIDQYGSPESVKEDQVNAYRCIYIGKHFFETGFYRDLLHCLNGDLGGLNGFFGC